MRKNIYIIVLFFTGVINIFSLDFSLSAGGGGIMGGFFTRYTLDANGIIEGASVKVHAGQDLNQFNYGFFLFLDGIYGVLGVSFQNGINNFHETADISVMPSANNNSGKGWDTMIGISLLGKYPFSYNDRLTIFPMLGVEYQISLRQQRTQPDGWIYDRTDGLREKDKNGNAYLLEDWNALWVNLGCGLDYELRDNLFFRSEFLYCIRTMTSYEIKNLDLMKKEAGDPNPKLGGLTSGPLFRISVGYRFFTR